MKIALGLCYYEDLDGIQRLFDSLEKTNANVYRIFAIDGKYKQFSDSPSFLSSPEVHQYLEQFPKVVNYTDWKTFPTEIEKRNKYLELCSEDIDFLIVVDTDEYFTGDWDLFVANLEKLKERLESPDDKTHPQAKYLHYLKMEDCHYPTTSSLRFANRPRIFYRPSEIRYKGSHYTWVQKDTGLNLIHSALNQLLEGITIVHDDTLREKTFERDMKNYQEKQLDFEKNEFLYFDPREKTKINPLIFIPSPRDIPQFMEATAKITLPKYWVKYYTPEILAYIEARRYFLQEKQYTHFVILPDDLIVTENDLFTLLDHFSNPKTNIVSGYCNVNTTDLNEYANICLDYVTDIRAERKYIWLTLDEVSEKKELFKAKFSGFPLMAMTRKVVEDIQFRNDSESGLEPNGCCIDVTFCVDAHKKKYDIFVDPTVKLYHMKIADGYYDNMGIRVKEPHTKLETSFISQLLPLKP